MSEEISENVISQLLFVADRSTGGPWKEVGLRSQGARHLYGERKSTPPLTGVHGDPFPLDCARFLDLSGRFGRIRGWGLAAHPLRRRACLQRLGYGIPGQGVQFWPVRGPHPVHPDVLRIPSARLYVHVCHGNPGASTTRELAL